VTRIVPQQRTERDLADPVSIIALRDPGGAALPQTEEDGNADFQPPPHLSCVTGEQAYQPVPGAGLGSRWIRFGLPRANHGCVWTVDGHETSWC